MEAREQNGGNGEGHQGESKCETYYYDRLLGLVGKSSKAFGGRQKKIQGKWF
jgi:hypothetical protein